MSCLPVEWMLPWLTILSLHVPPFHTHAHTHRHITSANRYLWSTSPSIKAVSVSPTPSQTFTEWIRQFVWDTGSTKNANSNYRSCQLLLMAHFYLQHRYWEFSDQTRWQNDCCRPQYRSNINCLFCAWRFSIQFLYYCRHIQSKCAKRFPTFTYGWLGTIKDNFKCPYNLCVYGCACVLSFGPFSTAGLQIPSGPMSPCELSWSQLQIYYEASF